MKSFIHSGDSIDELKNAFDLAERSSPGISELFTQLILTKLQNGVNVEERSIVRLAK